ncbi:hypothetical protein L1987_54610 [Smallanthus sonchifolius]|uniref:Uncharacterized protein n=1 Tax=Smallanthus sonchifolius TaxID=185202 RepID=A0ACB9E7L0_9ASTR|nr:hypothetical protein L1987_54610 [Smallanthus sonchifolius]
MEMTTQNTSARSERSEDRESMEYVHMRSSVNYRMAGKGPHIPKTANADGLVLNADPDLYSEENKKLTERDNRALGSIILALSTELYLNFEQHEIAQGLWNAFCLRFEGNAAL